MITILSRNLVRTNLEIHRVKGGGRDPVLLWVVSAEERQIALFSRGGF